MVVTLGQQYNTGEKPTVMLYTYIDRQAGTPDKKQKKNVVLHNDCINRFWTRFVSNILVRAVTYQYLGFNT